MKCLILFLNFIFLSFRKVQKQSLIQHYMFYWCVPPQDTQYPVIKLILIPQIIMCSDYRIKHGNNSNNDKSSTDN